MFDAIVVGSGMSGGWAAKELCEKGLKTLVIERGGHIEHGADYTDSLSPWEVENFGMVPEEEVAADYAVQSLCYAFSTANKHFWVKDSEHPYTVAEGKPFKWIRGYHLGGRSLMWARQSYRLSPMDFESNAKDGHGSDWPIRYEDMAPWYDHVEKFAGISGSTEGLSAASRRAVPAADGADRRGKGLQGEARGGLADAQADHRPLRSSDRSAAAARRAWPHQLPVPLAVRARLLLRLLLLQPERDASGREADGNLTIVTDSIVHSVIYDPQTGKASGVRVIDAKTKEGTDLRGEGRIPLRLRNSDSPDPAQFEIGGLPQRDRQQVGRGRPLSDRSSFGCWRRRHLSELRRPIIIAAAGPTASTSRASAT